MFQLNNANRLYAKGTCNVVVRDPATGNVDYQSNKVQTAQFTTTVDMGAIQAGIGNSVAINIPHNAAVNLTLTTADFDMATRAMSVGSQLAYGGIAPVCETIVADSAQLKVGQPAAAPYGISNVICNVVEVGSKNPSTEAYTIDGEGNVVGYTATVGNTYVVTFFSRNAVSQYFTVGGMFSPSVKHVTVQVAVFSVEGVQSANQGTKVGDLYIIIPRMQFSGKADIDGSQTANAPTDLSGTALTYDEAQNAGACTDCAIPGLAQVMYVPNAGAESIVQGMAVVGGAFNMTAGDTAKLPIKWLMPDGSLAQPDYTAMTYEIASNGSSIASVDTTGTVTANAEGSTEITVTLTGNTDVTCVANINVAAN